MPHHEAFFLFFRRSLKRLFWSLKFGLCGWGRVGIIGCCPYKLLVLLGILPQSSIQCSHVQAAIFGHLPAEINVHHPEIEGILLRSFKRYGPKCAIIDNRVWVVMEEMEDDRGCRPGDTVQDSHYFHSCAFSCCSEGSQLVATFQKAGLNHTSNTDPAWSENPVAAIPDGHTPCHPTLSFNSSFREWDRLQ